MKKLLPMLLPMLLGYTVLVACQQPVIYTPTSLGQVSDTIPAEHAITLESLLARYNANAALLAQLYARTSLELAWREDRADGTFRDRHEPECSGKIIYQAPDKTAVTVEKLGTVYLWAGSDAKRYWLFDHTRDERVLSFGRLDGPATRRGLLGLPMRPQDLPVLMGLKPLAASADMKLSWCVDKAGRGFYQVEGRGLRLLFAPGESVPVRAELTDAAGKAQVVAEMSGTVVCENGGKVRATIAVYPVGRTDRPARLDLTVDAAHAPSDKVKDKLFDLDGTLIPANKPDKVVDLDLDK